MDLDFDEFEEFLSPQVEQKSVSNGGGEHARLQYLLDNTPAIIYASVPTGDFRMTYVSNNAYKVLGYEPEEMTADPNFWFEHIHPDDTAQIFSSLALLFSEGERSYEYRFMNSAKDYIWVHDMLHLIRDEHGDPLEVVGSLTDISERKKMEDELRHTSNEQQLLIQKLQETQQQLLQAEKMASVGQLAAGIAHEINNPLGFVNSNMNSLQSYMATLFNVIDQYEQITGQSPLTADNREAMTNVAQAADLDFIKEDIVELVKESLDGLRRVKDIVQSLKDFSHIGETDWQQADIHQGIDSTLNIVSNEIRYKAIVTKHYGKIPLVECVISELNQVMMNLLINAAHAIQDKGVITIATGTEQRNGIDCVWIKITDNGAGIEPHNLTRIFEPFFTTKPVGSGTGLGLSLAYGIINKHKGEISVKSVVGKGTQFTINLPVVRKKNDACSSGDL